MPNLTGGKNYKKTKHSADLPIFVEKEDGQLYARVLQILGNRNTLAYCNDNVVRLCHIRGSIRKDMWINVGDIVLISVRDFLLEKDGKYEKGDILYKYDREHYSKLKKDVNMNPKLFVTLETASVESLKLIKQSTSDIFGKVNSVVDNEDIFDHEEDDDDVDVDAI